MTPNSFRQMTFLLCTIGAAALPARAAEAQAPGFRERLDSVFTRFDRHARMMGSVTIRRGDRVLYQRSLGYRDSVGDGWVRADSATAYRVGSVAKPFTAVLIYQLIDEGRLTLETSLATFFPSIAQADRITIRDLLGHTSGLPDHTQGLVSTVPIAPDSVLQRIAARPLHFPPGTRRQYSNSNFYLLGRIVEQLGSTPLERRLQQRIVAPLALRRTYLGRSVDAAHNEARAYYFSDGHWELQEDDAIGNAGGAGAVVASSADLATFLTALFAGRLISPGSLHEMTTGFSTGTVRNGKGLSPFALGVSGREGFSHDGSIGAHTAVVGYEPQDSLAVAIVVNGHNYPINRIFFHAWRALYGAPDTLPTFVPLAVPDSIAAAVAGDFHAPDWGIALVVRSRGGAVEAQSPGQSAFPLVYLGGRRFMNERDGILLEFGAPVGGRAPALTLLQQKYQIPMERRP